MDRQRKLFEIAETYDPMRLEFCPVQGWEDQCGKNGDDGDDNEQFNQRECRKACGPYRSWLAAARRFSCYESHGFAPAIRTRICIGFNVRLTAQPRDNQYANARRSDRQSAAPEQMAVTAAKTR